MPTKDIPDFDITVPVLIAGAGACGLSAALAVRDAGVEALVLDGEAAPGGNTAMSHGAICAAGSWIQREAGIEDDPRALYNDILAATRGQTDPRLAHRVAHSSGGTIDWLMGHHQVALQMKETYIGEGHTRPRLHVPARRSGLQLMEMLLDAAGEAGADVLCEARVADIYADPDGRVRGVQVMRPDGGTEDIGCDSLIIATSGFGANQDMVTRFIPSLADAPYCGPACSTGDGILWGLELGAAVADLGAHEAHGTLVADADIALPQALVSQGAIRINQDGRRFEDETRDIAGQALRVLQQPGGVCYLVYDSRVHVQAEALLHEYRLALAANKVVRCDTQFELSDVLDVPLQSLAQTLDEVNTLARQADEEKSADAFNRVFRTHALQPPYFAVRVTGGLLHTQGGLVVDAAARVVREDGAALPNVFAGGGAARGLAGRGGFGYLPGMGLCTALTLGRIAGESAAQLVGAQNALA